MSLDTSTLAAGGAAAAAQGAPAMRARARTGMVEFAATAACVVVAVALMLAFGGSYNLYILNLVLLASIGAIGLNLLMGTAGQVSIGNAAFLTTGAFATVWCERNGIMFPYSLAVAMFAAGLFGAIVGLPALRIKGLYLILATMAAHFLALFLAEKYQFALVGSAGFIVDPVVNAGSLVGNQRQWAMLLTGFVLVVMLGATWLQHGRTGRAWRMIRDREDAAPAMGIPTARYKLTAFVISSAIIGLQGALTAHFAGNVSSESFTLHVAIAALAMILIGGLGSIAGSVIGAAVVTLLPYVTPSVVETLLGSPGAGMHAARISLILYGVLIIFFIGYARDGVKGWIVNLWKFLRKRAGGTMPGASNARM